MRFEVLIPFYNEAHRFEAAIRALAEEYRRSAIAMLGVPLRFSWADDGSTDSSGKALALALGRHFGGISAPGIEHRILHRETNAGKGSAMRFAIDQLRSDASPNSIVAFWDADGELLPEGLFEALRTVHQGSADIAFGSRFSKRNPQVLNFRHYLGNKALTLLSNYFSNLNLSDVHCCARVLRAGILFQLPLTSCGFDFEAEFVAIVGRVRSPKLRLIEIPVTYIPRAVDEGKKIGISHVWPQIYQAIRCRYFLRPLSLSQDFQAQHALS